MPGAAEKIIALIIGEKEFWSLPFTVSPATLIPRPDSETLIEAVLATCPDRNKNLRIVDLGVGSGCLLLALLHEYKRATGVGVDATQETLKVARGNAEKLGLLPRADFVLADWNEGLPGLAGFDLIISNPPYIPRGDIGTLPPEVALYEPHGALCGGGDGLRDYRTLIDLLPGLAGKGGRVFFEVGINQADTVAQMMKKAGMEDISIRPDLAGIGRCVEGKI